MSRVKYLVGHHFRAVFCRDAACMKHSICTRCDYLEDASGTVSDQLAAFLLRDAGPHDALSAPVRAFSRLRTHNPRPFEIISCMHGYDYEDVHTRETGRGLFQHRKCRSVTTKPLCYVPYRSVQMQLLGSTALEEEEGADDRTPVPMDFLMEVMETRESLEQCSSQDEVEAISAETATAIDKCLRDMDEAFKAGGGKEELSDAAVRLRYLFRIQKEAQRVLHGLEDSRASPDAGSA